jgi:hypothetical protein
LLLWNSESLSLVDLNVPGIGVDMQLGFAITDGFCAVRHPIRLFTRH